MGIGVVTAFVFIGSEDTIDAPRLSDRDSRIGQADGSGTGQPGEDAGPGPGALPLSDVPVVRVVGGAPPVAGPLRLRFERGARVRFRVESDMPIVVEVPGYGIRVRVEQSSLISFPATRPGQFPVVVANSEIGIASVRVT